MNPLGMSRAVVYERMQDDLWKVSRIADKAERQNRGLRPWEERRVERLLNRASAYYARLRAMDAAEQLRRGQVRSQDIPL